MQVEQRQWSPEAGWTPRGPSIGSEAQIVFVFGGTDALANGRHLDELRRQYPKAHLFGGSTAGEILGTHVADGTIVATAVHFDATTVRSAHVDVAEAKESAEAGRRLARALEPRGLRHVFVVSDGQHVNGSDLVEGMRSGLPAHVQITGGLAGDGARFQHTLVVDGPRLKEGQVAAIGLYGDRLTVGFGSLGGWDAFGPHRMVTRSRANVLYELDGQPALALYKKYLGEHAAGLPATGLLFPLSIRIDGSGPELVRTILSVDEEEQSLTFAGDVPEGAKARLMKANFDRLVDGAHGAAERSRAALGHGRVDLALLVSCVGRKLVLKQRTEQELEAVRDVLGPGAAMTGFYSYGEICPTAPDANCELHNQTMTITTFAEAA